MPVSEWVSPMISMEVRLAVKCDARLKPSAWRKLPLMNRTAFTIFAILVAILLSFGLRESLDVAPTEATMGNIQRIFYYHVPSYVAAFTFFFVNLCASVI